MTGALYYYLCTLKAVKTVDQMSLLVNCRQFSIKPYVVGFH